MDLYAVAYKMMITLKIPFGKRLTLKKYKRGMASFQQTAEVQPRSFDRFTKILILAILYNLH